MKAVEIIMIPVTDQQKANEFYMKLGFQVVVEAPSHNGETWIQLGLANQGTTISLAKFSGIIFETGDIEKEIRELKSRGVSVEKIDDTPWGRFAWMKDPDGNGLCLHQR